MHCHHRLTRLFQTCFRPRDLSRAHAQLLELQNKPCVLRRPARCWTRLPGRSPSLQWDLNGAWWDPVGPSSSLQWDPDRVRWDAMITSSSLRGTRIGFRGTPWVPALLYVGPESGFVGPRGSQLFSTWDPNRVSWDLVGPRGSQPFSTWDPTPRLGFTMLIRVRGGPLVTIFT